jgi:ATP-dependent 26S proteasome regulatory subunit
MSSSGRFVAVRRGERIEVMDALGASPRRPVERAADDFAIVGSALWVLGGGTIERLAIDGLRPIAPVIDVGPGALRLDAAPGDTASVLVTGARAFVIDAAHDPVQTFDVPANRAPLLHLGGRRVLVGTSPLHLVDAGRGETARFACRERRALAASYLFGGRALAVLFEGAFTVLTPQGSVIHRIALPDVRAWAIAEQRGTAFLALDGGPLLAIDLRYGRITGELCAPFAIDEMAVDGAGQFAAFAGEGTFVHLPITELARAAPPMADASDAAREPDDAAATTPPVPAEPVAPCAEPPPSVIPPGWSPRTLGEPLAPFTVEPTSDAEPYESAQAHVDELLDVVVALAARAIAEAWNSGRLSVPANDRRPFEREVLAILGDTGGYATDVLAELHERVSRQASRVAQRAAATIAAGHSLPWIDLARDLGLSAMATQVLAVALAPYVRGEVARLYGVLANDEHRPLVDRYLIETVIAGNDPALRAAVAEELAPDAPLVRYGLVHHDPRSALFGALVVDEVVVERVRGRRVVDARAVTVLREADRPFDALQLASEFRRTLLDAVGARHSMEEPLRLVLRGRAGCGRTTAIAALAARVEYSVAAIDAHRIAGHGEPFAEALRVELRRARLARAIPVVSGLELPREHADDEALIQEVLRAHPGPIVLRTSPEALLPLDPGYVSIALPALNETERLAFWHAALERADLTCRDPGLLATRYRIGPGTITRIVQKVARDRDAGDVGERLDAAARQHVTARLQNLATRVTRLPQWEQVALPEDILDSLKELIARVRHRRAVFEDWGFDTKMTTSRGLSALFYGPPGTGKSMVAGLIARELGLDLYRVDLSRVVSKWIGETEKNLSQVFDAAEDGQVVLLFDEADSLFAKRSEVKSSNDRYANLEVNYLLQRLDAFEGICLLTTNLDGSIDPAFKRRMTVRLQFPFPDEDMRTRLWAAHVPPQTPIAGPLDFADLARRFPLSGGYIRNSALRAAFLAAQEARPLAHEHLVRAVQLEYRELGKLSTTGHME